MSLPAAPTNVTVVPGVAQATVSWAPSTSSGVTGYKVFCNPDNKLPNLATANATSLNVTKLKNGVAHAFRVHAINAAGMSATSAASVPGPPPAAPKVVAVRGSAASSVVVTVSGKPQKGSSLTFYNFSVAPPAPNAVIPTNVSAAALTFGATATITGPTGTSVPGVAKPVIAGDVPGAPTITSLSGIGSVQISWNTPPTNGLPILGYAVSYKPAVETVPPTPLTVVKTKAVNLLMVKGLVNTKDYTFSVKATNAQGDSVSSNSLTVRPT